MFACYLRSMLLATTFFCLSSTAIAQENHSNPHSRPYGNSLDNRSVQAKGTFSQHSIKGLDGKERPYIVYQPKLSASDVAGSNKRPLLVYLHGAVTMENIRQDPMGTAKRSSILELADKGGYYVLFPYGQKGATWFDGVGIQMVQDEIAWAKKHLPIDPTKIFLSGFSDGASGTLYFAHTHSDGFAGFIALNGSLAVATSLGESQLYPQNSNHKPIFIVNTQSDMLYPSRMIAPIVEYLKLYNPNIIYKEPAGGHDTGYLSAMTDELRRFIDTHAYDFMPTVFIESADDKTNQIAWLSIDKVDFDKPNHRLQREHKLTMHNDKAGFGVKLDGSHKGAGVKVAGFSSVSTAKNLGVEEGDVILKMGAVEMNNPYAPYKYLSDKKAGDDAALTIQRGDKTLVLTGKFNQGYDYKVFDYKKPSAMLQATLTKRKDIVVRASNVAQFSIDFSQMPLNEIQNINVIINDKTYTVPTTGKRSFKVE